MPAFRQIESRLQPASLVQPGPAARPIDLSPVAQGLDTAAAVAERAQIIAERQRRESEALLERQQQDEARVAVTNAVTARRAAVTEQLITTESTPGGMAGATERALKDHQAWVDSTAKTLTPAGQKLLALQAPELQLTTHEKFFGAEVKARQTALVTDFSTGLDAARRNVIADPAQFSDTLARQIALANTLNLPDDTRAKMVDQARQSLAFDAATTIATRNPDAILSRFGAAGGKANKDGTVLPSDPAKALAAVQGDPVLSQLSPDNLRQVVERATMLKVTRDAAAQAEAERQARLAEIAANQRARAADQAWAVLSGRAMTGVATDEKADAPLFKAIAGTPYAAEYQRLAAQIPVRTAVATLPLNQQQAQIDALIGQRNANGTNTALEEQIKFRKEVLAAAKKQFDDSPLRAGQQYGLYSVAPLDTSSFDALLPGLAARVPQADLAGRQAGKPAPPLLPEEASRLGDMLAGLPPADQGQRIAQLASVVPPQQMLALAQQIGGEDKGAKRALSLQMQFGAAQTVSGRYRSELVARGAQVVKDRGVKEDTSAEFGLRAQIAKEVGDSLPPKWREDAIDAARLMYLGQQAEGISPSVAGVVRLAAGGAIVEHNGRRIPIPAGTDESTFADKLKAYPAAALASQAPGGAVMLPGGRQMPVADFLAGLPSAQLEPVAPGRYGVRAGGGIVKGPTGRPIIIEVN